ncbi:hypothetical protein [Dyadobacter sandarakinus]|uniref:DUF3592 domain-containing protein n=1 Tax=Dyadobacter sandarakinus TaxID=2747268 RepID=A0ABX7I7C1_9BACT|nr:hypothetical protein [Dyadobacter sandarakinus]QRR01999.1 hypothetical protein HWI92_14320 [Dyadobacter sandarakinus]
MEYFIYTLATLLLFCAAAFTGIFLMRARQERCLANTLRNGREFDGIILDVFPIRPIVFHAPNVWLRVLIFPEKGEPHEIRFVYESTCLEWPTLFAGNHIRVAFDPCHPEHVHILSPQQNPEQPASSL